MRIALLLAALLACTYSGAHAGQTAAVAASGAVHVAAEDFWVDAPSLQAAKMHVRVYLPPGYQEKDASGATYPVLYVNDGQDMQAVGLEATLARLYGAGALQKLIVVAIDAADRASIYGLSDRAASRSLMADSRIGPIGAQAHAYAEWLAKQLVPAIEHRYRARRSPAARAVLGWSLGGLNAFDLGWQYQEVFGIVGAFSPSFWLAADRSDGLSVQRTRLAQRMVDEGHKREGLRIWLSVGDTEETNDRDGNGVIDAVDDVLDLARGYSSPQGETMRGLAQLGYAVDLDYAAHRARAADVAVLVVPGGRHNQAAWAEVLPEFLLWAFGREAATTDGAMAR